MNTEAIFMIATEHLIWKSLSPLDTARSFKKKNKVILFFCVAQKTLVLTAISKKF